MIADSITLDAAALDGLPRNADCLDDDEYDALRNQSRAALAAMQAARADERERCAKVCEAWAWDGRPPLAASLRYEVAAAIRALGPEGKE